MQEVTLEVQDVKSEHMEEPVEHCRQWYWPSHVLFLHFVIGLVDLSIVS